jgi:hypothetical protein
MTTTRTGAPDLAPTDQTPPAHQKALDDAAELFTNYFVHRGPGGTCRVIDLRDQPKREKWQNAASGALGPTLDGSSPRADPLTSSTIGLRLA